MPTFRDDAEIVITPGEIGDIYYPDTPKARAEAMRMFPDPREVGALRVVFCDLYRPERLPAGGRNERICGKRDPYYRDNLNPCRRCVAGFMAEGLRGQLDRPEEYE